MTYADIIARLEKATGPNDKLDIIIAELCEPDRDAGFAVYTASIDAALGLVERMLPGWSWEAGKYPFVKAALAEPVMTDYGPGIGIRAQVYKQATVPLAILLALFRALEAREAKHAE